MGRGPISALVALLGLALVAFGCGGGDDSLTKAEFIKQGDAICKRTEDQKNKALEAAFAQQAKTGEAPDKAFQISLVNTVALPPVVQMTEELDDLGPPDEEAEAIVAAFEASTDAITDNPAGVLDGSNPFVEADQLAAEYGFKACSET